MKTIMILLFAVCIALAALAFKNISVVGNVKDESGKSIAALVQAGSFTTTADARGNYQITLGSDQEYLDFSATGYIRQKVKINGQKVINVVLKKITAAVTDPVLPGLAALGYSEDKSRELSKSNRGMDIDAFHAGILPNNNRVGIVPNNHTTSPSNTESYNVIADNRFHRVSDEPLSTFAIDVDAAAYGNVRRYLNNNELPPAGAVRTEEMINYFKYQYEQPRGKDPFSINTEISDCPWNKNDKLVLIGLQGKTIPAQDLPASNLVFLIDVSGSMSSENKLPLVKASLKMLTGKLREKDRISIVTYAGQAGLALPATSGSNKTKIKDAIDALEAGGSTNGSAGIELAYRIAQQHQIHEGNNRIILCTDGDFNIGATSDDDVVRLIEKERSRGIYLSVLGVGMGNYKDSKMELLADKGNGNYAYLDGINEADKVLIKEFGGTLYTIAKDVKIQVEFNPNKVEGYRLIGYEDRYLNKEDFNDDSKDAGELGSGHAVTALYEIIPAGVTSPFLKSVDPLKYQRNYARKVAPVNEEILTVKFRYKTTANNNSVLLVQPVTDHRIDINKTSDNFRFAAAVAGFAMLLRKSEYRGTLKWYQVINIANGSLGKDADGYRKEFVSLVKKAENLADNTVKD